MSQIQMGLNAQLELRPAPEGNAFAQLWLDPDLDGHPNAPGPQLLCLGTPEQLTWVGTAVASVHALRFVSVESPHGAEGQPQQGA